MLKKRMIIVLIFIVACCYFFNSTYASKIATVYLSTNQEIVEKGQEIEIAVNIENAKTAAFSFVLYFDESKLEYISNVENTNVVENRILFVWFDKEGGKGEKEGELARFKFRAKEEGIVTFSLQGEFYSQNGQLIQTDFKEEQLQIGNEISSLQKQAQEERGTNFENGNANLKVLRLDREGMTPNFDKNIQDYYLTIPNNMEDIDVLAIAENPNATVEVIGNNNLQEGLNEITIHVISQDKIQNNIYTIEVTKTANLELANANLEILAIENTLLNPPFDANETNYKIEIANETESINLFAVPENEQANVAITGKDNLKEGNNLASVIVTAPNGFTKKKYQIEVYRRNLEEEKKYEEEQERQKENLENAYKVEELSSNIDEFQEQATDKQTMKYQNIIVWSVLLLIVAIVIMILIWRIKNKKLE